jgi:hypothetical protein
MNPFEVDTGRTSISYGSPLDPVPRQLWAALLVVVVLSIVPALAIAVGGRLGTGLTVGLLFAIGGIVALRVGTIFGTVDGRDVGVSGAEGTWTLLAAGGAALIMTFAGLAAGAAGAPRAARLPMVTSTPPPDEPALVAGDQPEAIIEVSEAWAAEPDPTQTRTDAMPAATPSGTTYTPSRTTYMPSGTTDMPSGTPDKPSGTTDKPSGTPDKPSGTPDKPNGTPDKEEEPTAG